MPLRIAEIPSSRKHLADLIVEIIEMRDELYTGGISNQCWIGIFMSKTTNGYYDIMEFKNTRGLVHFLKRKVAELYIYDTNSVSIDINASTYLAHKWSHDKKTLYLNICEHWDRDRRRLVTLKLII